MLRRLKDLYDRFVPPDAADTDDTRDHRLRLSAGALLVSVLRADFERLPEERDVVLEAMKTQLRLGVEEAEQLLELSESTVDDSVSLYSFTREINDGLDYASKVALVEWMWRVALADAYVEAHEEHLLRKISQLLYVEHDDYIAAKQRAREPHPAV